MNKDYVRLTIGMNSDFKKRLRHAAARVDLPMSEYIYRIIEAYLVKQETSYKEVEAWVKKERQKRP